MMDSIAGMATNLSTAKLAVNYSVSMTKKVMDSQEQVAQGLLEMLPPAPAKGEFIDVYA